MKERSIFKKTTIILQPKLHDDIDNDSILIISFFRFKTNAYIFPVLHYVGLSNVDKSFNFTYILYQTDFRQTHSRAEIIYM